MKAEDTVMSWERMRMLMADNDKHNRGGESRVEIYCGDQAQITWDIAFKAGQEAERKQVAALLQVKGTEQPEERIPLYQGKHDICPECNGTGMGRFYFNCKAPCEACKGTGRKLRLDRPKMRAEVLPILVAHCQTHEHRGCVCSLKEAEGCWGSLVDQILPLLPDDEELRQEGRREVVEWVEKYKELTEHGDYSNGVEAFGLDEGRVMAHRLMDEYEKEWQAFKKERGI